MTGLRDFNYPAFHAAAAAWREKGWNVVNPAEHFGGAQDRKYHEYVAADVAELKTCVAVAMLPGWNAPAARGSVWEYEIARQLLGLVIYDAQYPVAPLCALPLNTTDVPISRHPTTGALGRWIANGQR